MAKMEKPILWKSDDFWRKSSFTQGEDYLDVFRSNAQSYNNDFSETQTNPAYLLLLQMANDWKSGSDKEQCARGLIVDMMGRETDIGLLWADPLTEIYSGGPEKYPIDVEKWQERFIYWLFEKSLIYASKLLTLETLENRTDGLLADLLSKNRYSARYNDTPDTSSKLEDYYEDDSHATNTDTRISETTTPADTPMGRLREILAYYPDIRNDFVREFERGFAIYHS